MNISISAGRNKNDAKSRFRSPILIVACAIAAIVALVEFFVLAGDVVSKESVSSAASPVVRELRIERVGEEHLLEIYTRNKSELKILVQDPTGEIIHQSDEMTRHKRRFLSITPTVAGVYKLTIERDVLLGSGRFSGRIELLVNDRRVIAPLLYAIGL